MSHFDERAETWDEDPDKLARAEAVAQLLRDRLPLSGTERVLEIGGGTGQLSLQLADDVGSVTVTDASEGMVRVAARNIEAAGRGDRLHAELLDLTADSPALDPASYDGAWSMLALHHVPDVDLLLRRLRAGLADGAWCAIVDLDHDAHGSFHAHLPADEPIHDGFRRNDIARRMTDAGFAEVTVDDAGTVSKDVEGQTREFPMFLAVARA